MPLKAGSEKGRTSSNTAFLLAALSLCCCTGFSLAVVHRFLIEVASLAVEHGLQGPWAPVVVVPGLQSTGPRVVAWAEVLSGMWDPPTPGIEPVSLHWKLDFSPLHHQWSPEQHNLKSTWISDWELQV